LSLDPYRLPHRCDPRLLAPRTVDGQDLTPAARSAAGDNVNVAARLEPLGKSLDCTLVVSETAVRSAGLAVDASPRHLAPITVADREDGMRKPPDPAGPPEPRP
jgi:hypothetical protein